MAAPKAYLVIGCPTLINGIDTARTIQFHSNDNLSSLIDLSSTMSSNVNDTFFKEEAIKSYFFISKKSNMRSSEFLVISGLYK